MHNGRGKEKRVCGCCVGEGKGEKKKRRHPVRTTQLGQRTTGQQGKTGMPKGCKVQAEGGHFRGAKATGFVGIVSAGFRRDLVAWSNQTESNFCSFPCYYAPIPGLPPCYTGQGSAACCDVWHTGSLLRLYGIGMYM